MSFKKCSWSGRQKYTGVCSLCNSNNTTRWYRKFIKDKVICKSCYQKERLKNETVAQTRRRNNRKWNRSFKGAVKAAKAKNATLELSQQEWEFKTKVCFYCSKDLSLYTGVKLDRVDNSKGYTNENTVGCCRQCNVAKNNYSLEEFKNWIEKVHSIFFKQNVDLTKVIEMSDNTDLSGELACANGVCEVNF